MKYNPEKIENDFYNPLIATTNKVKYYLDNKTLIFTFDLHHSKTEALEIPLACFTNATTE